MLSEVDKFLSPQCGDTVVDCTVGGGGHAAFILNKIKPDGQLIGVDCDNESLEYAQDTLKPYRGHFKLIHDNFRNLKSIITSIGIKKIDRILFDLGVSSYQFESRERGFSFQQDGPLDMRMDRSDRLTAFELVNNLPEEEIARILWEYGNERYSRRIARSIVIFRKKDTIRTTGELVKIIIDSLPRHYSRGKIHPATRSFQALRIAVNRELDALKAALTDAIDILKAGGRICVISFHSLEDGIVKRTFRQASREGRLSEVCPKPVRPQRAEILANPRARSARLRWGER